MTIIYRKHMCLERPLLQPLFFYEMPGQKRSSKDHFERVHSRNWHLEKVVNYLKEQTVELPRAASSNIGYMLGGPPRDGGNPRVNSSPRAQAPDQQDWAMTLPDHSDNADTSQPVSINPARSGELNLNQSVIHSSWIPMWKLSTRSPACYIEAFLV